MRLDVAADAKNVGLSLDEPCVLVAPVTLELVSRHSLAAADIENELDQRPSSWIDGSGKSACVGLLPRAGASCARPFASGMSSSTCAAVPSRASHHATGTSFTAR